MYRILLFANWNSLYSDYAIIRTYAYAGYTIHTNPSYYLYILYLQYCLCLVFVFHKYFMKYFSSKAISEGGIGKELGHCTDEKMKVREVRSFQS